MRNTTGQVAPVPLCRPVSISSCRGTTVLVTFGARRVPRGSWATLRCRASCLPQSLSAQVPAASLPFVPTSPGLCVNKKNEYQGTDENYGNLSLGTCKLKHSRAKTRVSFLLFFSLPWPDVTSLLILHQPLKCFGHSLS